MEEAANIGESLVHNHLVACVNIVPSIRSVYWWDNKVNHDDEVLMIMKTEKSKIPALQKALRALHSYQTPELIALDITDGMPEYLRWIEDSLAIKTKKGRS